MFSPETATHLNAAFGELNQDGIVPQINSGFRTDSDQTRMQNGGSGSNPAAMFSWHQAGGAVDLNGTHSQQFGTITSVMKAHGFVWGGDFQSHKDPPHFDGRNFLHHQWGMILGAEGYWNAKQ
ncbi:M15 family metallopeptidase [Acidicapsa ligni]|uniref:M15 family metallopeptidase n=1 Tax=Acidicapsa ligni TaxID=542300 RepID=UPI0021DFEE32|nr:M15 family metallopeptidase [Acidicapsa ligni]